MNVICRGAVPILVAAVLATAHLSSARADETSEERIGKSLEALGVPVIYGRGHVTKVELQRSADVTIEHLKLLANCPELSEVEIPTTLLSAAAIACLAKLPGLRKLAIQTRADTADGPIDISPLVRVKHLEVLGFDHLTDEWFEALKLPSDLDVMAFIFAPKITDRSLRRFASSTTLRRLELNCNQVTDEGLLYLKDVNTLRELHLYESRGIVGAMGSQITGSEFGRLKWMKQLERMTWSTATDEGIAMLKDCRAMVRFDASYSSVTDESLAILASFPALKSLGLAKTEITDTGLRSFVHHARLEDLYLHDCELLTDAGLEHLATIPRLKRLLLRGTKVTDVGAKKLKAAIPNIVIEPAELLK